MHPRRSASPTPIRMYRTRRHHTYRIKFQGNTTTNGSHNLVDPLRAMHTCREYIYTSEDIIYWLTKPLALHLLPRSIPTEHVTPRPVCLDRNIDPDHDPVPRHPTISIYHDRQEPFLQLVPTTQAPRPVLCGYPAIVSALRRVDRPTYIPTRGPRVEGSKGRSCIMHGRYRAGIEARETTRDAVPGGLRTGADFAHARSDRCGILELGIRRTGIHSIGITSNRGRTIRSYKRKEWCGRDYSE